MPMELFDFLRRSPKSQLVPPDGTPEHEIDAVAKVALPGGVEQLVQGARKRLEKLRRFKLDWPQLSESTLRRRHAALPESELF